MRRIRSHLTYANVMATLAVFLVLGGGAYAAFQLPKNSVRSKNIVRRQVKRQDVAKGSISESKLKAPAHFIDLGFKENDGYGCPGDQWLNAQAGFNGAGYARDGFGFVHLRGYVARCETATHRIFTLRRGYRPQNTEVLPASGHDGADQVSVSPGGAVFSQETFSPPDNNFGATQVLDGLTFRCAPSGQHGCP